MDSSRPDPDELLKAVQRRRPKRGFLKIFLGASAGVGKTYAMLSEAHEQAKRGVDIVIGYVETHKREDTQALTEGIESIDLKSVPYRNSTLQEPDIQAIISRKPEIVLIDELAHTNAPGSIHAKRWQDVSDLLDAGIGVFTAVNIQHLESLNDVVAQVTGLRVQETVPDSFFEEADEIELIDLPPAELQNRLREGKVYVPERIEHALEGFFKVSNLTALRELALRRTADSVDAEMRRLKVQEGAQGAWATKDRIIVCIAPNKMGARVVRAAARLGVSSRAELIAVYVESDRQSSRGPTEHENAREALDLAEELGIEVVHLQGHDIVGEIIALARRRNATLVVVGKPIKPKWKEFFYGSVVDELVRASGNIDVHVITGEAEEKRRTPRKQEGREGVTRAGLMIVAISVLASTGLGFLLFDTFGPANVAMVYVLGVALSAIRCNRMESGILSLLSVLSFNFFFIEPRFTFAVSDVRYLLLFGVILTIGIVISSLTHRLREQIRVSTDRERRTASLYGLSKQLAQGRGKREIGKAAAREIGSVFDGEVAVFLTSDGKLDVLVPSESGFEKLHNELAVATWVVDHKEEAGIGTTTLPGSQALYIPLKGVEQCVGALAFRPRGDFSSHSQRQLLETFVNGLGLALERAVLAKQSNDARLAVESERIRSTLLSSISHDLRTPLTSISGAASSLLQGAGNTKELVATIASESDRLNHQVENLLDMTRLQTGNVQLKLEWQSPQELVASALEKCEIALKDRKVALLFKGQIGLFQADALLIEKALINLYENAGKFTKPGDSVTVTVFTEGGKVVFLVSDSGPGITQNALGKVFSAGFKAESSGFGLGLSIVEAITRLHKGKASATNSPSGGAVFRLEFPLPAKQPEAPSG